jgi:hypothetical protein
MGAEIWMAKCGYLVWKKWESSKLLIVLFVIYLMPLYLG